MASYRNKLIDEAIEYNEKREESVRNINETGLECTSELRFDIPQNVVNELRQRLDLNSMLYSQDIDLISEEVS